MIGRSFRGVVQWSSKQRVYLESKGPHVPTYMYSMYFIYRVHMILPLECSADRPGESGSECVYYTYSGLEYIIGACSLQKAGVLANQKVRNNLYQNNCTSSELNLISFHISVISMPMSDRHVLSSGNYIGSRSGSGYVIWLDKGLQLCGWENVI